MRRPSAHEVAALDGDEAAAVVDLAFRSGDHRLSAEQCHAIAKAAVRALRDAGMLRAPEPATAVLALLLRPYVEAFADDERRKANQIIDAAIRGLSSPTVEEATHE